MNFLQAMEYIHSTHRFGSVLGLSNMEDLMKRLGDPQKQLKFVHVAGTNGKGSAVSFLTSILIEAGYKTGMYTSPFMHRFNERIQVNKCEIENEEIAELTSIIKQKTDEMVSEGKSHPTEFELVTAMAFLYFARHKCDIVVLEVGLGGRLDATNIIEKPLLSVITTISFDHMDVLGDTLSKIAYEKAGIIKENIDVVVYPQEKEAIDVIKAECKSKNAKLTEADFSEIVSHNSPDSFNPEGQIFSFMGFDNLKICLLGEHQQKNASLALLCALILKERGFLITEESIRTGLCKARWQGRFEMVNFKPIVIIDGAHNLQGVEELSKNLCKYFKNDKINFIMGVLKDKDYQSMINYTLPIAKTYMTITPSNPRALNSEELCCQIRQMGGDATAFKSIQEVCNYAVENMKNEVICVFGSLYFLGEIRWFFGLS